MEADGTSSAVQVTPVPIATTSSDGVPLAGVHLARPGPPRGTALVVAHGFTHHVRYRTTRSLLASLGAHAPVVALDMRGHGRSGGRSTVGDREPLDLDAGVAAARRLGYERVATVGFSLGAAVALRQAAAGPHRPDAVVAVSSPARWYSRETSPMRQVHWLLEQPHGRLAARAMGVRLDGGWEVVPPSPVEVVGAITAPLLLVHIAGDRYFAPAHARALASAAGERAELWEEPGDGHGESGTHPELARRIAGWALAACTNPDDARRHARSTVEGRTPAERRAAGSEVG
ncbi:alpha/beta hydrolase family protein [Pseudonocardia kunmingensis]|uniref:Serine aminopeptidase S33 family n=1 Tax=Pseudonocardia kunmingensis TaxID=630975 RepID=A0A543DAM9_9PSEU|nr:alpha/beta fold hydrolase [Pseudonocardia kunmingensis]TQM06338.1 serine aminopeptidase S33 family [Pseudonocardia kunmingensis]